MTRKEIFDYVNENGDGKYEFIYADGRKEAFRVFISITGNLCRFFPHSTRRGYIMYIEDGAITSVRSLKPQAKDKTRIVRNNLKNIVKYTTASGLWPDIKATAEHYLGLDDQEFDRVVNLPCWNDLMDYEKAHGLTHFTDGGLLALSAPRTIKAINYHRYERDLIKKEMATAIENKRNFSHHWYKGYDNSVSCELGQDNRLRAWYSEEYKGCGNGHYYLALDESHALFCEND